MILAWQGYLKDNLKAHDTYLAALVKYQQKRQKENEAQRSNTIGSLKGADVCINWAAARHSASELASALALRQFFRSITEPMSLAQSQPQVIV